MIIGLTGKNASGKGEALEFLSKRGFIPFSLSDVIREELKKEGKQITRGNLVEMGNKLRKTGGAGVLSERILKKIDPNRNHVIDSFRNPVEVEVFCKIKEFSLINIESKPEIRFERIKARGRENDPQTYEDFLKFEELEAISEDETHQRLEECQKMADYVIHNNDSLVIFQENLTKTIQECMLKTTRPTWDEYFMNIAKVVASRGNCIKRKVAAVIVKDKRIISTGYNGTPRGTTNCDEGGCPRCFNLALSGENLSECLCSHAEENAITQAAYHGTSVRDSSIYTTLAPCLTCTKMIINSGIEEIVYNVDYTFDDVAFKLCTEAGVKVRKVKI
jgi:dCMP deaminase